MLSNIHAFAIVNDGVTRRHRSCVIQLTVIITANSSALEQLITLKPNSSSGFNKDHTENFSHTKRYMHWMTRAVSGNSKSRKRNKTFESRFTHQNAKKTEKYLLIVFGGDMATIFCYALIANFFSQRTSKLDLELKNCMALLYIAVKPVKP